MFEPDAARVADVEFIGRPSPTAPRIQAGGHPCQGLYYAPKGKRPKTAVIATHYNVDFSEHYIAPFFAERGYGFLGWNTRYRGAEDQFILEHALIDISVGMTWLREEAGVERIVILGNSGGGSLMGAYQAEAIASTLMGGLNGAGRDTLASLPKADLYIALNAHQGRPEVLTDWMDASVTDETDPLATDAELDPFNPEIRRSPTGRSSS
jgi:dienelactone hydrolase